jgi:hypothetical protein
MERDGRGIIGPTFGQAFERSRTRREKWESLEHQVAGLLAVGLGEQGPVGLGLAIPGGVLERGVRAAGRGGIGPGLGREARRDGAKGGEERGNLTVEIGRWILGEQFAGRIGGGLAGAVMLKRRTEGHPE